MSTRSLIAKATEHGFEAIYCHSDGYPEHHGPILTKHYATEDAVNTLLELGDLSVLGAEIGEAHEFRDHGDYPGGSHFGWCRAYGRDRGDKGAGLRGFASEEELFASARERWAAFAYLFRDGRWFCRAVKDANAWTELRA